MRNISGSNKLLSETESLNYRSVSFDILLRKVVKKLLSVTNHLGETSLRMEILRILLHVLGEGVDSIGEDSNLNLGRARVLLVDLVLFNKSGLGFLGNHFFFTFLYFLAISQVKRG